MNPPSTRNGAWAFRRGYRSAKDGSDTVAQIRVSFPTLPHLQTTCQAHRSARPRDRHIRELHSREVGALRRELRDEVRVEVDASARARIYRRTCVNTHGRGPASGNIGAYSYR